LSFTCGINALKNSGQYRPRLLSSLGWTGQKLVSNHELLAPPVAMLSTIAVIMSIAIINLTRNNCRQWLYYDIIHFQHRRLCPLVSGSSVVWWNGW